MDANVHLVYGISLEYLGRYEGRFEDVILEALAGLEVPIALGLSSGHTTHPFVTLPLGVRARLTCGDEARFEVQEAAVA
jgi:muramoyltetrapeptide carboxypeptidase LdcA involved in peptidoglycan recycling